MPEVQSAKTDGNHSEEMNGTLNSRQRVSCLHCTAIPQLFHTNSGLTVEWQWNVSKREAKK